MKNEKIKVLIVEDEEFDVRRITNTLQLYKSVIEVKNIVSTGKDALNCLRTDPDEYDVIILDFQISGGLYGKELIKPSISPILNLQKSLTITALTGSEQKTRPIWKTLFTSPPILFLQ